MALITSPKPTKRTGMNPKEKAKKLFDKYQDAGSQYYIDTTKKYALICVDEILANIDATIFYHKESVALPFNKEYWQEVKEEINKIN